jgi:AGZA family xanthine/uracil permease-like MFS transporter
MRGFFKFEQFKTDYRREIIGGLTTFFAMAYIIIVNPAILADGGIPREPGVTATIVAALIGTLIMALYANRPFAVAPYMGENAFIAYTVCLGMGYSWQKALGAVFLGGVIFIIITALHIRRWIAQAIPDSLKRSFAAGIGFFIMFIGLNETGIIRLGVPGAPVRIGDLSSAGPILAITCILLVSVMMIRKIPGALLIGMLVVTILAYITGIAHMPDNLISAPPSLAPIFMKLDLGGIFAADFISIVWVIFVLDFVDTMGTLIGVSARAGLLDENGNLPEIEKPMMADAIATTAAALLGTSTTGAFIESAAGTEAGARTGFASLVTALMFALCLFLAPVFVSVPAVSYGAALVVVGFLMLSPVEKINFADYTELFPAAATIALMSFTFNIGFGMTAGFILYPLFKILAGRRKELSGGIWVLFFISLLLFILYPYKTA